MPSNTRASFRNFWAAILYLVTCRKIDRRLAKPQPSTAPPVEESHTDWKKELAEYKQAHWTRSNDGTSTSTIGAVQPGTHSLNTMPGPSSQVRDTPPPTYPGIAFPVPPSERGELDTPSLSAPPPPLAVGEKRSSPPEFENPPPPADWPHKAFAKHNVKPSSSLADRYATGTASTVQECSQNQEDSSKSDHKLETEAHCEVASPPQQPLRKRIRLQTVEPIPSINSFPATGNNGDTAAAANGGGAAAMEVGLMYGTIQRRVTLRYPVGVGNTLLPSIESPESSDLSE